MCRYRCCDCVHGVSHYDNEVQTSKRLSMNYDLTIQYKDGRVSMRFLGIDFFALDKIFGTMPIKRLSNYCFGIFNPKQEEPIYIQSSDDNIAEIISVPITNLHSLLVFSGIFRIEKIFQYISWLWISIISRYFMTMIVCL